MSPPIPWKYLRHVLVLFAPLWGGSALLFGLGGIGYALVRADYWSASQPMVLRDEVAGGTDRIGRFTSQSELKAAQETVLEMARNHEVVAAALRQVGPDDDALGDWPSTELVVQTARKRVNVRAPQGGEFGSSEVFYLQVEQRTRQRAERFCQALFDQLDQQLRQVRRIRAESMLPELTTSRDLAHTRLQEVAQQLHEIETAAGPDLGELRQLTDAISGEGTNRRALEERVRDLQSAELELEKLQSLHDLLARGLADPTELLVSGGELLRRQPSLQRLKQGLIDAQLVRSRLSGMFHEDHPRMRAALMAERSILKEIKAEIAAVLRSTEPLMAVQRQQVARLRAKSDDLQRRLQRLAELRTRYSKLTAELKHRTTLLEQSERALAEAEASYRAAQATSLVARLGPVTVADSPNGPSGKLIALGGTVAGLIFGLGAVFLVAPTHGPEQFGRRWSDRIGGRRASDQLACTTTASPAPAEPAAYQRRSGEATG